MPCTNEHVEPIVRDEQNGETQTIGTPNNELISEIRDFPEPPPDVTGIYNLTLQIIC